MHAKRTRNVKLAASRNSVIRRATMLPIETLENRRLLSVSPLASQFGKIGSYVTKVVTQKQSSVTTSTSTTTQTRSLSSVEDPIIMDPVLAAALATPKLRKPGQGIELDPNAIPGANAPATSTSFDALNFDQGATSAGFYNIPPDNSGAAGPNHLVDVVNTNIEIWTKAGVNQLRVRLGKNSSTAVGSFFQSLSPVNGTFDPKVIYDAYNSRFVVVTLEQQDTANGAASNTSRALLAVSDDSDPNGTWYFQAINTNVLFGATNAWFDYPGNAVDANAIYLTGNMFSYGAAGTSQGSRLWIINKTGLYTGGTSTVNVYDPSTASGMPGQGFTLQPAMMYGAAPGTTGTWLVNSGWTSGANDYLSVIRVDSPLGSPTFTNTFVLLGDTHNGSAIAGAPQPTSANTIDFGDTRVYSAAWRSNALWATNTINPTTGTDAGTATVHWYKLTATNLSTALADQGNVGAEDLGAGTRTSYGAITVDSSGNMGIGFAASGSLVYPGAYYTGRLAGDAAGTVQSTGTLKAGTDYYYRTFGSGRNRWGDYSGIAIDPADGTSFWVFNQYAMTRGTVFGSLPTEDGRWATRWGKFSFVSTGTVTGTVYEDRNGNSTLDGTDAGLSSILVWVDYDDSGALNGAEPSASSNVSGVYSIANVATGSWKVRQTAIANNIQIEGLGGHAGTVVSAGGSVTRNFGNFPYLFTGTAAADSYYVRSGGTTTQIWVGTTPPATATYSVTTSLLPSLTFDTLAGDDSVVVDYSLGNPVPTGGLSYLGGTQSIKDTIDLRGTNLADPFSVSAGGVITHGTASVTGTGLESAALTTGTFSFAANSNLASMSVGGTAKAIFNSSQTIGALSLAAGAVAEVATNGNRVLTVNTLSIAGTPTVPTATLELQDNDLIVKTIGARTTIQSLIVAGQNGIDTYGPLWTGQGIRSTAARTQNFGGQIVKYALGVVRNGDLDTVFGIGKTFSTFDTVSVGADDVLVKFTYGGDADLDGSITISDYVTIDTSYAGLQSTSLGWAVGDFDLSGGGITISDYVLIDTSYAFQTVVL